VFLTIRSITAADSESSVAFATNLLIQGNTRNKHHWRHGPPRVTAIYVSNSAREIPSFATTSFRTTITRGFQFNGDVRHGRHPASSTGALVENNIIRNSGSNGMNCDGLQNSRIQNNLIYNNNSNGICLFQIDGADGSKNNVIVNNTIYAPSSIGGRRAKSRMAATGNKVYNNILIGNTAIDSNLQRQSHRIVQRLQRCHQQVSPTKIQGVTQDPGAVGRAGTIRIRSSQTRGAAVCECSGEMISIYLLPVRRSTQGTNIASPNQAPTSDADGNSRAEWPGFFDIRRISKPATPIQRFRTVTGQDTPTASANQYPDQQRHDGHPFSEPIQIEHAVVRAEEWIERDRAGRRFSYDSISYTATLHTDFVSQPLQQLHGHRQPAPKTWRGTQ